MSASETCSRCGREVRWGWRDGIEGYLHREAADHVAIFGHIQTDEERAEIERQLDLPRERRVPTKTGFPLLFDFVVYTTRELDHARYLKNEKFREREALETDDDDEEEGHDELEPIEVPSTPITTTDRRMSQGVKNVYNTALRVGWEVYRASYARGPWLGSKGKSLGVSDTVVLGVRGLDLDGRPIAAVASWRDGKSQGAWLIESGMDPVKVGVKTLTDKMKEVRDA